MSLYEKIYAYSPVFLQNIMISAYGYQWKQRRFGGVFQQAHKAAKERENYTAEQWQQYQNAQLQKLLLHAYETVPFYKNAFDKKGITAQQLKSIDVHSIQQLPILTKQHLRQFGTTDLLSGTHEKNGAFFSSSGSTGTPTKILLSHAMHQRWFGIYEARIRNWAGVSSNIPRGMIGGRRIVPTAANTPPFYRYNYFEKQVYFSAYHISKQNAAGYLKGIQKHNVQYMTGYAMSNYFLARFFKELNIQPPALKAVIASSEKLTGEMRNLFSDVYNCKTFDSWASVESCGIISECEHGKLHISPDAGIIEVLDDEMQPVTAEQEGIVYCTGLLNYDQPLIRYSIGDRMILSGEVCSCKRQMPVVKEISGRVEDAVIAKDGREMVRFHSIFYDLFEIKQAQVIQESLDKIFIKAVTEKPLSKEVQNLIKQRIIGQLGSIEIDIEEVPVIPLNNNGKFQAVISKVKRKEHENN